jgi:MerR family copper efflux transcriptional regulator
MAVRLPIATSCDHPSVDSAGASNEPLRVGDLAARTQKTVRALHLYEELGLLSPIDRSKGNYRLYDAGAVLRVRWIAKLQDMGFSLPAIREVLSEWERSGSATNAMAKVRTLYQQKLEDTRAQLARLSALELELESSIHYLDTCDTCAPERLIDSCPRCELHESSPPDLVAGLHAKS